MQGHLDIFWKTNIFPPAGNVITLPWSSSLQPDICYSIWRKLFYIMLIKFFTIFRLYVVDRLKPSNIVSLILLAYCSCYGKINENYQLYLYCCSYELTLVRIVLSFVRSDSCLLDNGISVMLENDYTTHSILKVFYQTKRTPCKNLRFGLVGYNTVQSDWLLPNVSEDLSFVP